MKKLLLSGAALFLATVSFAQNVVTTTQNGTSQTATANQSGSSLTATISQVGSTTGNTNNQGVTFQTGTGHSALINQNNGSTYNRAGIGQVNGTSVSGANSATISQSDGAGGTSMQTGVPASAVGTEGNWAGVAQTGGGNRASIVADGVGTKANFAETWQKGNTNTARTSQSNGSINTAEIFQGDDTRGGSRAGTSVEVTSNTAVITQGRINPASQNFTPGVAAESVSNTATITQIADGNNALRLARGLQLILTTTVPFRPGVRSQFGYSCAVGR